LDSLASRLKTQPSAWLQELEDSWENPVFENAPPPIPRLREEPRLPPDDLSAGERSKFFGNGGHDCGVSFESGSVSFQGRISKSALTEAEVVAQVDRKFILIKLPLSDRKEASHVSATDSLIMLDQHAVDERCKLEDLMAGYFVREADSSIRAVVEPLVKPLLFDVGDQELELLQQWQPYFTAWGIIFETRQKRIRHPLDTASRINITALPPSIMERCSSEPKLLIDLLRREVWEVSESHRWPAAPFLPFVAETTWISNFHRCPRAILDLLHSRACRSAIMFNDVLSKQECEQLLERLSRCSFPFQCAHGRPSMAPLVDLGVGSRVGGWDEEDKNIGWRKWMDG
jgi:DNA mismatch repair protein MLH3